MKLFICVFLVLVILEEYQCDPCLDWLFGRRSRDNDREKKLSAGLGFSARTTISGGNKHDHKDDHRPIYHPYHRSPPYGPNVMGNRPMYHPYYPPSMYPSYHTPYSTYYGRPFSATHYIPHGSEGRASNGTPKYGTPYYRGSYGPEYDRPRYEPLSPTPVDTAHRTPNVAPNGSSYGAPNGSPNTTHNGRPDKTPVETDDGTQQKKHYTVTPTGIQESPLSRQAGRLLR